MRSRITMSSTAVAATIVALCGACVLREETIRIERDGRVHIDLQITGTEEELNSGDAMPRAVGRWHVAQRINEEGEREKLVVTSSLDFAPGEPLPQTLASDDDLDVYLNYPTELHIERRHDGIYYTFHRTYTPRCWANTQYWHDGFFNENIQRLADSPLEDLDRDDRHEIIKAFAGVEAFRQLEFARAALADVADELPIEIRLAARLALLRVYAAHGLLDDDKSPISYGDAMIAPLDLTDGEDAFGLMTQRCEALQDADRDNCYDAAATKLFAEAFDAYTASLRRSDRMTDDDIERFELSYQRAKKKQELTDSLGGQHFETTVLMPGTIVAHNANEVERDEDDVQTEATWRFQGNAFRDRTQELWAISRVTWEQEDKLRSAKDGDNR